MLLIFFFKGGPKYHVTGEFRKFGKWTENAVLFRGKYDFPVREGGRGVGIYRYFFNVKYRHWKKSCLLKNSIEVLNKN